MVDQIQNGRERTRSYWCMYTAVSILDDNLFLVQVHQCMYQNTVGFYKFNLFSYSEDLQPQLSKIQQKFQ